MLLESESVRDPLGLNERLFALWYPIVVGIAERAGQRETRRQLIGQASGRTLEVGAGSGLNLPYYTSSVTELVVSEPSPHMRRHLRAIARLKPSHSANRRSGRPPSRSRSSRGTVWSRASH